MIKLKKELSQILYDKLNGISDAHGLSVTDIEDMLEYPPDSNMGDLALHCFKLSKALRMGPPMIAYAIGEGLECEGINEVSVAGGYLNFKLDDTFSARVLNKVLEMGDKYGSSDMGVGKTVVLDYSSPNVAKPFHIGHLGTTVIGHSIKKMHEFAGYKCVGINYLGDWGTQFGKLITAYKKWGSEEAVINGAIDELVALYVKFHAEAEADESLNDLARAEFKKLEEGDEENIRLWKWFISISLEEYEKTYKQLGITFDSYKGESFYTDKMPAQVQKLRDMGLLKIDDGASIVDLSEDNMPPCLILKKDGSTLYPTRDIAAAVYRKETYNFDKAIYVTSAGQSLHFAQWFKVVEKMGYPWFDELVHVPYGTVSINGAKLATRTGNVILLKDLFALAIEKVAEIMQEKNPDLKNKDDVAEAVGVGAIIFYYLSNSRIKDINFIMEDALSFEGNTGPYVQYTYARCCSILEKVGGYSADVSLPEQFTCTEERELAKTLSLFEEKLLQAMREYEPSVIARYILDVCAAFNRFYHECHIATAPDEVTKALRVRLTAATKQTLGNAFDLICLRKPEKI
ncbi:MAG: arginine--tRNA ligase [Clostridia bacterium]|nr:arginine--tRNA ligase [Clostridia bacterium]